MSKNQHPIVSFNDESLILVNPQDDIVGYSSKDICHDGEGLLHRAFSIFLFNREGAVLLQQRSFQKRLWPHFWSNTCCSHPRRGENIEDAATRRMHEELAVRTSLQFVYQFIYQASYQNIGSEHELCSVFVGRLNDTVQYNPHEISATQWMDPHILDAELLHHPNLYTPWLHLEWVHLRTKHWPLAL